MRSDDGTIGERHPLHHGLGCAVAREAVGESALATGARQHLVRDHAFAKEDVVFCGCWKRDTRAQ